MDQNETKCTKIYKCELKGIETNQNDNIENQKEMNSNELKPWIQAAKWKWSDATAMTINRNDF